MDERGADKPTDDTTRGMGRRQAPASLEMGTQQVAQEGAKGLCVEIGSGSPGLVFFLYARSPTDTCTTARGTDRRRGTGHPWSLGPSGPASRAALPWFTVLLGLCARQRGLLLKRGRWGKGSGGVKATVAVKAPWPLLLCIRDEQAGSSEWKAWHWHCHGRNMPFAIP